MEYTRTIHGIPVALVGSGDGNIMIGCADTFTSAFTSIVALVAAAACCGLMVFLLLVVALLLDTDDIRFVSLFVTGRGLSW